MSPTDTETFTLTDNVNGTDTFVCSPVAAGACSRRHLVSRSSNPLVVTEAASGPPRSFVYRDALRSRMWR